MDLWIRLEEENNKDEEIRDHRMLIIEYFESENNYVFFVIKFKRAHNIFFRRLTCFK